MQDFVPWGLKDEWLLPCPGKKEDDLATYGPHVPLVMHFIISHFIIILHWVNWIPANHTKSSKLSLDFSNPGKQSKHN